MNREGETMIRVQDLVDAMYAAMVQAAVRLPPDVEAGLRLACAEETDPLALEHLAVSLENARLAGEGKGLVCGDTGFPLYFVKRDSKHSERLITFSVGEMNPIAFNSASF